jgi:very-short-patch-repair endonuclease
MCAASLTVAIRQVYFWIASVTVTPLLSVNVASAQVLYALRRYSCLREATLSYKERMHPKVSKAEIDLFKALSAQGLTGGMVTQQPIILKSTIPDFCWMEKRKIVYLDGNPVHKKDKQLEHDEEIDDLLTKQRWKVLRIKYDPPLTEKGLLKIMAQVKEFLNVDEEPLYEPALVP